MDKDEHERADKEDTVGHHCPHPTLRCSHPTWCHPAWRCSRPRRTRCEGLESAVEIAKTLPILFIVIQPTFLSSYVCEIPKVLLTGEASSGIGAAPGFAPWGHIPTAAETPFNFQHISRAGLTDKQVMAMLVLSHLSPNMAFFIGLIALELVSATFFLANKGNTFRPNFRVKAVIASLALALAWGSYEAQVFEIVRLWNSEYDPSNLSANLHNQSHPQVWFDINGPEELWCNIPSGTLLVRLVALVHILLALPFLVAGTPSIGELWSSSAPPISSLASKTPSATREWGIMNGAGRGGGSAEEAEVHPETHSVAPKDEV